MSHLVGIDKGPVMDWTNDSGLDEQYRKWKKWVEVLFKGPLNAVLEAIKCNYVIYWSGDHGMDLVDKWTTEGKINDGNKDTLNPYWTQFEEYIHPQTNQLIAVVELKWLFQGSLSLEDFHTKALRLVTQAGYEGDAKDRVLSDTVISGLASDKIRAKIVKKGSWSDTKQSDGDSKAGSFHTTPPQEDARDCKGELCPVWKVNQI